MKASVTAAGSPDHALGERKDLLPRWAGWMLGAALVVFFLFEGPWDTADSRTAVVLVGSLAGAVLSTWVTKAAVPFVVFSAFGTTAWPDAGAGTGYLVVLWMPFVVGARYGPARALALVFTVLLAELAGESGEPGINFHVVFQIAGHGHLMLQRTKATEAAPVLLRLRGNHAHRAQRTRNQRTQRPIATQRAR